MKNYRFFPGFNYIIFFILTTVIGCSSPVIKMNEPMPEIIKEYKNIYVRANAPYLQKTGIYIKKGETYSVLAKGKVNTWASRYPNRWEGPIKRLSAAIGNNRVWTGYYTLNSDFSGELKFGVRDGYFHYDNGKAYNPEYYPRNLGGFYVDIIVWKTNDYNKIVNFFEKIKAEYPENEIIQLALDSANRYKEIFFAEVKASKEIEETKRQIRKLKDESKSVKDQKPANIKRQEPLAKDKPLSDDVKQKKAITELETKLAQLVNTLEQVDEMKKQLEEEREKTALLSQQLDEKEKKEKHLLSQIADVSKRPAGLLISSPRDGKKTESGTVLLTGVIEDDQGLKQIKFFINGQPFSKKDERGIRVSGANTIKRLYINETIPLVKGENLIKIQVIDSDNLLSEKLLSVHRIERKRNLWAVIVGINSYPKVPKLKYAVNDALAFYNLLVGYNQIPEENVTLLIGEKATLTNLRSTLGTKLKSNARKEDMVIVFFAGHGATEPDTMSPDGDGLEKYLLPYDADLEDLYASALPMRELSHIFNRIRSERLIFIADACYSGASGGRTVSLSGTRANISDAFLDRITSGKGTVIIAASGVNEVSVEKDTFQHGVFTYYLLEALKGNADTDHDGLITTDEAYRYVSEKVTKATNQEQHPVKKSSVEGSLVISVKK